MPLRAQFYNFQPPTPILFPTCKISKSLLYLTFLITRPFCLHCYKCGRVLLSRWWLIDAICMQYGRLSSANAGLLVFILVYTGLRVLAILVWHQWSPITVCTSASDDDDDDDNDNDVKPTCGAWVAATNCCRRRYRSLCIWLCWWMSLNIQLRRWMSRHIHLRGW